MTSRREFLKKAALLSGSMGTFSALPPALARALNIEPAPGSTFMDAKHVVILMQENRSFDHMFASFRGVRGLGDPRAITLPDGNPVFLQSDVDGNTYVPFGLDIHGTMSTWMGDLPHGRGDQVAAGNHGKHDRWLKEKRSRRQGYGSLPLTLGYYEQRDIPFYHAFADAFTICDQHFCSVQSSTTPNRIFLWSGTNRDPENPEANARMTNGEIDHHTNASWITFPERLLEAGIPWKIYQNEIDLPTGFRGDEDSWLGNFGDNPMEYFSQYKAKHHPPHISYLKKQADELRRELEESPQPTGDPEKDAKAIAEREKKRGGLRRLEEQLSNLGPLEDPRERELHQRAFTTNDADPLHRRMTSIQYENGGEQETVRVPEGDVLYQFRKDVDEGKLPTISWLVAGQQFSDHPSAAWYGAWYVSEILDILTKNPEVWKNTIFMLVYDENDGYFDHIPPFVPPSPGNPSTGATSDGIDTAPDFDSKGLPIGLGYRVPLIIASPWSRGGYVCSEVFDLTSVLRFLEVFLEGKGGESIKEGNISEWRRTICGDLTSAFRTCDETAKPHPHYLERDVFIESIHRAKKKETPACKPLTEEEILMIRKNPRASNLLPAQEPGTRPSCALPYELHADGKLDGAKISISFEASDKRFGKKSLGTPFQVYAPQGFLVDDAGSYEDAPPPYEKMRRWSFAVKAGDRISHEWPVDSFADGIYHLEVHGPNGFYRELRGAKEDPGLVIQCHYEGNDTLVFHLLRSPHTDEIEVTIQDLSYGMNKIERKIPAGTPVEIAIPLKNSSRWYDLQLTLAGHEHFSRRYAGRMENGEDSTTDPMITSKTS